MTSEGKSSDQKKKGFGGLSGMVSDVETMAPSDDASTPDSADEKIAVSSQPPETSEARAAPRAERLPSAPGSSTAWGKWLFGILVVLWFVWLAAESGDFPVRAPSPPASPTPQVNVPMHGGIDAAEPPPGKKRRNTPEPDPTVRSIQQKLNDLGYDAGPEDGLMGGRTGAAIAAFQRDEGRTADGRASSDLLLYLGTVSQRPSLVAAPPDEISPAPGTAEPVVRERSASSSAEPELSAAGSSERTAAEKACDTARLGDYLSCLERERESIGRQAYAGKPDLSAASSRERETIEKACNTKRFLFSDSEEYYSCLGQELRELQAYPGKPDLSRATSSERQAIERACNSARLHSGPGDYYSCLRRELAKAGYR